MDTIVASALSTITGLVIGYLIKVFKVNSSQSRALKNLLNYDLVSQYYQYKQIGRVPRHVKESWNAMYVSYIELGGNSFVKDDIKPKWDKLESYEE